MKNIIFKIIVVVLIFTGCVSSCEKDDIDYSNIEDLYAQPLPVIQKCVEGKWKWYVSTGGDAGVNYSDNTFVAIYDNHCVIYYEDGRQSTFNYLWKKCLVNAGYKTYVMWNTEYDTAGWHFVSVKNDTLSVVSDPPPGSADIPSGFGFVRIK